MSKTIKAKGCARHHFWGEYYMSIALCPERPEDAPTLVGVLGAPWQLHALGGAAIASAVPSGPVLDAVLATLARYGADIDAVQSVAHSIDHGDPFSIAVDVAA